MFHFLHNISYQKFLALLFLRYFYQLVCYLKIINTQCHDLQTYKILLCKIMSNMWKTKIYIKIFYIDNDYKNKEVVQILTNRQKYRKEGFCLFLKVKSLIFYQYSASRFCCFSTKIIEERIRFNQIMGLREYKEFKYWILTSLKYNILISSQYIMTLQKTVIILLSLLVCSCYTQGCVGSDSDDLIQTGILQIANPSTSDTTVYAQVRINYQIPSTGFQTALSPSEFVYNNAGGIDFNLNGGRIGNSTFLGVSLFLRQDNRWTQIRVSYLASSRTDIWAGSFTANPWDLNQIQSQSGQSVAKIEGSIKNWPTPQNGANFLQAVYISGMRSSLVELNITLFNVTLNKERGIIGLSLVNATRGINQVTITYIVFASPHPKFAIASFNFPGTIPTTDYNFIGLSEFSQFSSQNTVPFFYGISAESYYLECKGNCSSGCLTKQECSDKNGNQANNVCYICPSGTLFNISSNLCQTKCGLNEKLISGTCECEFGFVRLGNSCINRCAINQVWNGSVCFCIEGYARLNNVCRQCPVNSSPSQDKSICVCTSGHTYDSETNRCVAKVNCPANSSPFIQNGVYRCRCNSNYYLNGNACSFCPTSARWDTTSKQCVCPTNSFFNGQICVTCKEGQFYNTTLNKCQCFSPRILSSEGTCICPNGLQYNSSTATCICAGRFEVFNNSKCQCRDPYFRLESGQCGLACPQYQWWSGAECVCKDPYVRVNGKCIVECGTNERWNGIECVCIDDYFKINGACRTCSSGTFYNSTSKACETQCSTNQELSSNGQCVCKLGYFLINSVCSSCPASTGYNSTLGYCTACKQNQVSVLSVCVCKPGYFPLSTGCGQCPTGSTFNSSTGSCDYNCGLNQIPFPERGCDCATGYFRASNGTCMRCGSSEYFDADLQRCVSQPTCPLRSIWNQSKLACICSVQGEYLISGSCQSCQSNQGWNGTQCVCRTGYYFIGNSNQCSTCSINSTYNSTIRQCVCNRGFYGNGVESCSTCHATCGRCTGPEVDKCTECYDVSYTFNSGRCTRQSPCVAGQYLDGNDCKSCASYCTSCTNDIACDQCTTGFTLSTVQIGSFSYSFCEQICGDGKRYELQCDDGNTNNGDGCSAECEQEVGYTCQGGTTTSKSICAPFNPTRTFITANGAVQFNGKVLQGVTLSYLPDQLLANGCPNCNQVLLVTLIQGQIFPSYRVNFRPTTKFKFLIQFDFRGIFGIPPFSFTLKINPDYAQYFSDQDLAQEITINVDTAILALGQQVESLTLDEILGNSIPISDNDLDRIFD